jgi:hypothetical protein
VVGYSENITQYALQHYILMVRKESYPFKSVFEGE